MKRNIIFTKELLYNHRKRKKNRKQLLKCATPLFFIRNLAYTIYLMNPCSYESVNIKNFLTKVSNSKFLFLC